MLEIGDYIQKSVFKQADQCRLSSGFPKVFCDFIPSKGLLTTLVKKGKVPRLTDVWWVKHSHPMRSVAFRFSNGSFTPDYPKTYSQEPDTNKLVPGKAIIRKIKF